MSLSIGELVGYVSLEGAEDAIGKVGDHLKGAGGKWAGLLTGAGLAAGGAFAMSLSGAMGDEVSLDKLSASLGLSETESKRIGGVAGSLYANAYGENLGEVSDAVGSVVKNIDGMRNASDKDLQAITGSVMDVTNAFDQDLGATTAAVGQMMRTGMAKDATEALDLITVGLQGPANKADDLMETMNEYGTQFRKMGLDGADAMGLIGQMMKAGARDSDVAADAIKEFSIRTQENLEQTTASGVVMTTELGGAFNTVIGPGRDMYKVQADLAAGGERSRKAFDLMVDGLKNMKDPAARTKTAVALFGTQAEDLGDALYAMDLDTAAAGFDDVGGAAAKMGKSLNDNASANITMLKRQLSTTFVNVLGGQVLPLVTKVSGVLAQNLGPALKTMAGFLNDNHGAVIFLASAIAAFLLPGLILMGVTATKSAIASVRAWVMQQVAATKTVAKFIVARTTIVVGWATMAAKAMVSAVRMAAAWVIAMGPIALVIAAVVGLGVLIYKNWDAIKKWTAKAWKAIVGFVKKHMTLMLAVVLGPMGLLVGYIIKHWDQIKSKTADAIGKLVGFVKAIPGKFKSALSSLRSTLSSVFSNAMQAGLDKVRNIGGTIRDWIASIPGKIASLGGRFGAAGRSLLQQFIDGMKNAAGIITGIAGNVWDTVKGLLNGAIERINRALEFSIDLPGPKNLSVNLPDIPRLATGGRATSETLAVIGEGREPESVLPDSVLRGLLERAHAAGKASAQGNGRNAPLIGAVYQGAGESADVLAERLWFKTRTRG